MEKNRKLSLTKTIWSICEGPKKSKSVLGKFLDMLKIEIHIETVLRYRKADHCMLHCGKLLASN